MRIKKHENCTEWNWNGCGSRLFERRPCSRGYICCGDCDMIGKCDDNLCGYIDEMIFG